VADPAFVVPRGTVQVELGTTFERAGDGGETWAGPEPLLRLGVLGGAELRLTGEGLVWTRASGEGSETTGSDLEVTTKVRLAGPARWRPATSLEAGVSLPTGGRAATSGGVDPFATLLASWALGERFSLDANLGLDAASQGPGGSSRVVDTFAALSLGASLDPRAGAFVEYYATLRGSGEPDEHVVDGGFTYLVTDDVEIDVSAGLGLSRAAPDFFVGAGVSWRIHAP
jgi:hypothetical protein